MGSHPAEKERRRAKRLAHEEAQRRLALHVRWMRAASAVAATIGAVVVIAVIASSGGHTGTTSASTGTSLLAAAPDSPAAVDGIRCETNEQVLFHIHAHLAVYVEGQARTVPAGIGIAAPRKEQNTTSGPFVAGGSCFSWLHSHTADGVIHIESPVRRTFTLGQYFDVWGQPLTIARVGPAAGRVTTYVDGRRFSGNPRGVQLTSHAVIQLDVGSATPAPAGFVFAPGL